MNDIRLNNANVMVTDFAANERKAFLRSIPRQKGLNALDLAPGIPARNVWMTDVSAIDRRSVKAYLAGRADFRVMWWSLNCYVHSRLKPHAMLEQMMYVFHARHHAVTLGRLQWHIKFQEVFQAILHDGVVAGMRVLMKRSVGQSGTRP